MNAHPAEAETGTDLPALAGYHPDDRLHWENGAIVPITDPGAAQELRFDAPAWQSQQLGDDYLRVLADRRTPRTEALEAAGWECVAGPFTADDWPGAMQAAASRANGTRLRVGRSAAGLTIHRADPDPDPDAPTDEATARRETLARVVQWICKDNATPEQAGRRALILDHILDPQGDQNRLAETLGISKSAISKLLQKTRADFGNFRT